MKKCKITVLKRNFDEELILLHSLNIPIRHSEMIEVPMKFKIKIKLQRIVIFEVPRVFI